MKTAELVARTGITPLNQCPEREIKGVYISDMSSDIITGAKAGCVLVTLQTHKSVIAAANLVDVAAIVFVKGKQPAEDVIDLANRAGIGLFFIADDTWTFARKLMELKIS